MKLNLGCGGDYREGWVNMDVEPSLRTDVCHDFTETPWPFKDETFDHILCSHVLEHVPPLKPGTSRDALVVILEEMHRVLKPGGTVEVIGPHWKMPVSQYFGNPSHYRIISPSTFDSFNPDHVKQFAYASTARFRVEKVWTSKRQPPLQDFLRIRGLGLTTHLRDRLGGFLNLMPYESTILVRKA